MVRALEQLDAATVHRGNVANNGEPESRALNHGKLAALKALEQAGPFIVGDSWPVVLNFEPRARFVAPSPDGDRGAGAGVLHRVVDQVGQHLLKQETATDRWSRLEIEAEVDIPLQGARRPLFGAGDGHRGKIDRFERGVGLRCAVDPRQDQQLMGEPRCAVCRGEYAAQRRRQRRRVWLEHRQLGLRVQRRERRSRAGAPRWRGTRAVPLLPAARARTGD